MGTPMVVLNRSMTGNRSRTVGPPRLFAAGQEGGLSLGGLSACQVWRNQPRAPSYAQQDDAVDVATSAQVSAEPKPTGARMASDSSTWLRNVDPRGSVLLAPVGDQQVFRRMIALATMNGRLKCQSRRKAGRYRSTQDGSEAPSRAFRRYRPAGQRRCSRSAVKIFHAEEDQWRINQPPGWRLGQRVLQNMS